MEFNIHKHFYFTIRKPVVPNKKESAIILIKFLRVVLNALTVSFVRSIIHFIGVINNGLKARGSMIVHMHRRSKIVFFLEDARWLAAATAKRKARTKEKMHPSSVIHCPGCTPYVFPCRGASRIIQIIASEMIISDDHATVDLAALKWHARVQRYLHLILDSIKGTYFMLYPKVFRNSRLPDERAIAAPTVWKTLARMNKLFS